ncbi:MAG TPA: cupin domain-containing protein [Gaiellaceae bacterium]|nr:cupin domain-containing protein [Gaiellaceae bacterium]
MAYTKTNLRQVENAAPKFDMPDGIESRFARRAIEGETLGLSLFTLAPGFRIPFGHKHETQEEVYVVVRGSGRVKVGDEIVELAQWDAIRFPKDTMRQMEAGPDGIEYLAFGAGDDPREVEMAPGWWAD